jgi:hypothetical protein
VGAVASGVLAAGGFGLMIASAVLHGSALDDRKKLQDEIPGNHRCGATPDPAYAQQCSQLASAGDDIDLYAVLFTGGLIGGLAFTGAAGLFTGLHFTIGSGGDADAPDSAAQAASIRLQPTGLGARMEVTW